VMDSFRVSQFFLLLFSLCVAYGEANEYTLHYTERFISGKRFRGTETIWVVKKLSNERRRRWNSNVDWRNVKKMNFTVQDEEKKKTNFIFIFLGGCLLQLGTRCFCFYEITSPSPK
jgi:hypothetical protein